MAGVAKLMAMVGLDTSAYKAGAGNIKSQNSGLSKSFRKISGAIAATFSIGAVIASGRAIKKWADEASIAARNVGLLTGEMIALNRVAIQGGLDVNKMAMMLGKLQTKLYDAAAGDKVAQEGFDMMGLSVSKLISMRPADMLKEVAVAAMETGTPLQSLAEVFGERLGPQAVVVLRQIAEEGLPAVDDAAGRTADRVEALGSRWAENMDMMKEKALGVFAAVEEGYTRTLDFWAGMLNPAQGEGRWQAASRNMEEEAAKRERAVDEIRQKRLDEQKASAEELRRVYIKSLEDQIAKEEQLGEKRKSAVAGRAKGTAVQVSGMERMAGAFGGSRPELRAVERQLQINAEQLKVEREISSKLDELKEKLDIARGELK